MGHIDLKGIDKYYGTNHVLRDINLSVDKGEFMTLLGPSGCGKTTTLRVVAGLENPQAGAMWIDGRLVINAKEAYYEPPSRRQLNLVFQSYALWPHMTVFDNVAFGLTVEKKGKAEIRELVGGALERMQIGEYAKRYPSELSGGQQQRVAIARAIVNAPRILLLDEPLSNLDAKLRIDMRAELKRLHKEMGTTVLYVTHDQAEALTLSTRVAVFFEGRVEQVDTPMNVYQNPVSLRMADFIGNPRINLVPGTASVEGGVLRVESPLGAQVYGREHFTEAMPASGRFDCVLGVRPEQIGIHLDGGVAAQVYSVMPAGSETLVQVRAGETSVLVKLLGIRHFDADQAISLRIDPRTINVYHAQSGALVKRAQELDETMGVVPDAPAPGQK